MSKLWKVKVIIQVIIYMAWALVEFLPVRLFRKSEVHAWVERKLDAWAHFCLRIMGMQLSVHGQANAAQVDWNRPVFVIANHRSYTDIPTILMSLDRMLGFVAKVELGRIPFLGYWMLQIGCLMIKRGKSGVGNEVNEAIRKMPHAPNLVIFPEGTRSKQAQIALFKSGAFRMAIDHQGIILPLAIRGTRESWEQRKNPGVAMDVHCEILAPLDVVKLREANPSLNHKDLMNMARTAIESQFTQSN